MTNNTNIRSPSAKRSLDQKYGMSIFAGARPYNLYTEPMILDFITALDPSYKPPDRHTISGKILNEYYKQISKEVNALLKTSSHLNIVTDKTTNIRNQRIINLSLTNGKYSFYYCSHDIGSQTINADAVANWVYNRIKSILGDNPNWKKINSFTNDTCNTMRSV